MTVNLTTFYSVQLSSGSNAYILSTFEAAQSLAEMHDADQLAKFRRWMDGDRSVPESIAESCLEFDCSGCYQSFSVASHRRSGGIYTHDPYSAEAKDWEDNVGFSSIQWGNPATARPA